MRARRWWAMPSASNGFERWPRWRCGSSVIVIASGKIRWCSLSRKKLVPRAIEGPEIDPRKCEMKLCATRGSNTTWQRLVGTGLHRIHHVEARPAASDFGRIGQAAERVFRDGACHRDGALDELRKHFRRAVAR